MSKTDTLLLITLTWAVAAYIIVPRLWKMYFRRHPSFADLDRCTNTGDGHPGDPVNIALLGDEGEVTRAMSAAGWVAAKPVTIESSVRIAADAVLHEPDAAAPVSNLFLFRRRQDLAFERPVKGGPDKRHHVRLWRWDRLYDERPVWFGAATFDRGVGFSHTTGQVTHHIAPDVDAERALIVSGLQRAGQVQSVQWIDDFHSKLQGKNGGGDPWRTDGRLAIVTLR
jgi:hypothetical protein